MIDSHIKLRSLPNINILEPSNICFNPSIIVSNPNFLFIFLKLISANCNLLFSIFFKVKASSVSIYCIEYKPLGEIGTSIIKLVITFSKGIFCPTFSEVLV